MMNASGLSTCTRRRIGMLRAGRKYVALIAVVMLAGCGRTPPPALAIPADDEIAEVRASLYDSALGFKEIPEFVVAPEHVPIILGHLRPAEYIRDRWNLEMLPEVGHVAIRSRDGSELKIRFFTAGHNPAVLTVDGANLYYGWSDGIDRSGSAPPPAHDGGVALGIAIEKAFKSAKK